MGSSGLVLRILVVFAYVAACCAFGFSFGSKDPPTTAAPIIRRTPSPPPQMQMQMAPARMDNEPHYTFRYVVQDARTGDFKSQEERRDGGKVRGTYSVAEPNGDLRVVSYSSDSEGGFRAEVRVEPGGAVLTPDDNGRTFSSFFPNPMNLFRTQPIFSGQPPEVSAAPLTLMPFFNQPQYPPPQDFYRPVPQPPAFERTAAPPPPTAAAPTPTVARPTPAYFRPEFIPRRPEFYPWRPETPAIPITPPPQPPKFEHHGDIITASAVKPQVQQQPQLQQPQQQPQLQQPQMFPANLQMMRRPFYPIPSTRPTSPTTTTTQMKTVPPSSTTPLMITPSAVIANMAKNPYFQPQPQLPFMRYPPMSQMTYPPPQRQTQQPLWNPYDAAAMGGTPFMLVRTYLVPIPGHMQPTPVVPSAPMEQPQRLVQQKRPEPTVPTRVTTIEDVATTTTTTEEREVPTTVVTKE